jgi:hypothetical protein
MGSGDKMADQTLERLVALVKQRTDVLP